MKKIFKLKLIVAIGIVLAATFSASADTYTEADAAKRTYLVPSDGELKGKKLLELSSPDLQGTYRILCFANTSYRLDISGDSQDNKANVQIWDSNQTFELYPTGGGYYRIKRNNKVLDVTNGQANPGTNVQIYEWNGSDAQQWKILKNDDGSFQIVSKLNENLALDIDGATSSDKFKNGVNVHLYTKNESDAQKWKLIPANQWTPVLTKDKRVTDAYFEKYLIENFAQVYDEATHKIIGKATLKKNYADFGRAHGGSNEHIVIDCETITELNNLGNYGDYGALETDANKKTFAGVINLKGIEYFTNLKRLELNRNIAGDDNAYLGRYSPITEGNIDLQYNTQLEYLDLDYGKLKEVGTTGIDKLSKLKYLNLNNNNFSYFDITPYPNLERLEMAHNFNLMGIDANRNEKLFELAIFDTMYGFDKKYSMQSLIDNFPNLAFLHAFSTYTDELDLSKHTKLQSLWFHNSIWGTRQLPKGNWLHKLDLSGCVELRDLHVQNMHISSLNIPSGKLGQQISDEYKDLQFCREVTSKSEARGGILKPYVDVSNNYRHIQADLAKWYNSGNKKYYYVYYLRTKWTGTADEPVLSKKKGYYDIVSYDKYVDDKSHLNEGNWSTKRINLDNTLADDGFDDDKVISFTTAKSEDTFGKHGVSTHTNNAEDKLCMISDNKITNQDAIDPEIFKTFSLNVQGCVFILKAGCAANADCDDSSDAPKSVCYTYKIGTNATGEPAMGQFFFDLDYPAKGVVTGVDTISANKQVENVIYYSPTGVAHTTPFDGINIMVTTYTDGSTSATKFVK